MWPMGLLFENSEDEIDLGGTKIIDLINITEVLPKIEIDQAEIDVVYKETSNETLQISSQYLDAINEIKNHLN